MADAIDDGLIKALEEIVAKDRTGFGRAALANVAREALSRHKAPLSGPTAWTSTMGQDPATDMAERLHNAVPLSVAGDDAERVARAWLEASGCRWCDLSPLQKTNHLGYAHAAIAALQARQPVAGDDVERQIAEIISRHYGPCAPPAEHWLPAAKAIAALQVTEGDKLLNWLGENVGMELSWGEIDGDLSECAWQVHRRQGGTNDREWNLIATGETPLAALQLARSQSNKVSKPL